MDYLSLSLFLHFKQPQSRNEIETFLDQYLDIKPKRKPKLGGASKETATDEEEGKEE
jgi:hypothetical protein